MGLFVWLEGLSLLHWALLPLAALTIYTSVWVSYTLFLHPLANYPGPFLAKLTPLWTTYHAWLGDGHHELWRCHERYGNVVRYGPDSLSFCSDTALKEIYGFKANVRKSDFYLAFPATKTSISTHSAIDRGVHSRKRRVLSQAFSDSALKAMESHVLEHVRTFCSNLRGGLSSMSACEKASNDWSAPHNMTDQANYLTFDIMGDLAFGKAFGMLEGPQNRFAIDMIGAAAHRHLICGTYLPIHDYHIDKVLFPKIAGMRSRYMQFSKAQAAERTKAGMDVDRKDFFYHLLNAKDPETGKGFSTAELWGESNLLIIAGSDTTSTALTASIFYLIHNPPALEKLQKEVRSAFTDVEEIRTGATLSSQHYLRACIDEAMRLSPSVGGVLPRQVLQGGMEIMGKHVPEGMIVGVSSYAIHHNPAFYPEPFDFKPERWIAGSDPSITTESVRIAQSAFCPFSVGPRGCIGKSLAYSELTTTLARVVFLYDMRLSPGSSLGEGGPGKERGATEFLLRDTFTSAKNGPMVEFRAR